jgi:hypothetical protein
MQIHFEYSSWPAIDFIPQFRITYWYRYRHGLLNISLSWILWSIGIRIERNKK